MNEISKEDKEHKTLLNKAVTASNLEELSSLMDGNSYATDYLRDSFLKACQEGNLPIISYFMTSKTFTPNALYARGLDDIFRNKNESVINWLIFDYNMGKSGAIDEALFEMSDRQYAKHIEDLFEKRTLNKKLNLQLNEKETNNSSNDTSNHNSHKKKI